MHGLFSTRKKLACIFSFIYDDPCPYVFFDNGFDIKCRESVRFSSHSFMGHVDLSDVLFFMRANNNFLYGEFNVL